MVTNIKRPVHHRLACCAENIAVVAQNVPIPRHSLELGLSYDILWHILHLDLQLHPYKVQLAQQLKPADLSQCRRYVEFVLEKKFSSAMKYISRSVDILINKIVLFGVSENPQVIEKSPLHPKMSPFGAFFGLKV